MRLLHTIVLTTTLAIAAPISGLAQDAADPRAGDPTFERSERLFGAIRGVLEDAAGARQTIDDEGAVSRMLRSPLGLDARSRADALLADAFEVISDAPVTRMQDEIAERRAEIADLKDDLARLREARISAPEAAGIKGTLGLAKDRAAIDTDMAAATRDIAQNEMAIDAIKDRFRDAMANSGANITREEADLLLDSVTGGDLVKIAAAYRAARGVSEQLMALMDESGEDLAIAKRYYAMHTTLIALLVHAQTDFIEKVDGEYLPKLGAIEGDIERTQADTRRLLNGDNTERQVEALVGNLNSQEIALQAAAFYRDHLQQQRAEVAAARTGAIRELEIADNTLRTVDASFQLRSMMESATLSFEALQNLESPGIERIFRNEQLRREFQELSQKLAPTS